MRAVLAIVAERGASEGLKAVVESSRTGYSREELADLFLDKGTQEPAGLVDELLEAGLLERLQGRVGVSRLGIRASLLVDALNGGNIEEVFAKLRRLSGVEARYELVREGMTQVFFESFINKPDFGRIYVCSPWINPSKREAAILTHVVMKAERATGKLPEVLVIARTPDGTSIDLEAGLDTFKKIGAKIFLMKRLHSKLYIREPGPNGGTMLAIVGSENLTRTRHVELGIKITSDSQLINQLIVYFLGVLSRSQEYNEGGH